MNVVLLSLGTAVPISGLTVLDREQEYCMEHTIKMACWLSFLDRKRVQAAGEDAVLREAESAAGAQVTPVRDGLLSRTGATPHRFDS